MNQPKSPQDQPLFAHAEETGREIYARCRTVERACDAIGFVPDSHYVRIASLVAKVAGNGVMNATVDRIAKDRDVRCTVDHARVCLKELQEHGVIEVTEGVAPPTTQRRRGRPAKVLVIQIVWDKCRQVVATYERWLEEQRLASKMPVKTPASSAAELTRSVRDGSEIGPRSARDEGEIVPRSGRDPAIPTIPLPKNPKEPTHPPPPVTKPTATKPAATAVAVGEVNWKAAEAAVKAAGVSRAAALVAEARQRGVTASELIDDAYVVQHCDAVGGGALFDRVRHHCWPASGVPDATQLRDERRREADAIRSRTHLEAPPGCADAVIAAVTMGRLEDAGLSEFVSEGERRDASRAERVG
ncbi:MAG: hypothetical protein AAGC97_17515 [Planctomycetota bacterium]